MSDKGRYTSTRADAVGLDPVAEQASRWVLRIENGLNAEQEQSFNHWLQAASENREVFRQMASMWLDMDVLNRLTALFPEPPGIHRATASEQEAQTGAAIAATPVNAAGNKRGWLPLPLSLTLAASLALAVTVLMQFGQNWTQSTPAAPVATYQTQVGEQSQIALNDGSVLTLNTNTRVKVALRDTHRVLVLEQGEIHLAVAHDAMRPLTVSVGQQLVQAIGTAFNIQLLDAQRMQLVVTEGKVLVAPGPTVSRTVPERRIAQALERVVAQLPSTQPMAQTRNVVAGQQLIATTGQGITDTGAVAAAAYELEQFDPAYIEAKLSWREGNLVFQGETLAEAIREISRYTSLELVLEDQTLAEMPVVGLFKAGDIDGLLLSLEHNFGLLYERDDQRVVLSRAPDSRG